MFVSIEGNEGSFARCEVMIGTREAIIDAIEGSIDDERRRSPTDQAFARLFHDLVRSESTFDRS